MAADQLRIFDWASNRELAVQLPLAGAGPAPLLAFSPDSHCMLHLHCGLARLVALQTGHVLSQQQLWQSDAREAAGLAWSSCGVVAVVSVSAQVQSGVGLYGVTAGHALQLQRWISTGRFVTRASFSASGQLLAWVDHGPNMAQHYCSENVVHVAHVPSGKESVLEELPISIFELCADLKESMAAGKPLGQPRSLPCPCAPLELSADLYWQADSSLLVVGPELGVTPAGGFAKRWPIKQYTFGAPSSMLSAVGNQLQSFKWSYCLWKELLSCVVLVLTVECSHSWACLILLPLGLFVFLMQTRRTHWPHRWCLDFAIFWALLRAGVRVRAENGLLWMLLHVGVRFGAE